MIRDGVFLLRVFALISLLVAIDCLRMALLGGVPMPPETHSGAMYAIPAELWATVSLAQAIAFFALAGTRDYLKLSVVAGLGAIINLALAVFSARAEFGFIQSRVTGGIGMMHCAICVAALIDALGDRLICRARALIHFEKDDD